MSQLGAFHVLLLLGLCEVAHADVALFAKPGRMVPVGKGSRLSLYCSGSGKATIILESGFGGGTAATWFWLQPLLSRLTRTCSYDRAGYGFSELGSNLPRDLKGAVGDLGLLLNRSGEKPPYVLAGHSNGGLMIGAFADLHTEKVAGLIFFDAAVSLPEDLSLTGASMRSNMDESLRRHLDQIRRCLRRAETRLVAASGDECVSPDWYSSFPTDLAAAEVANRSKPDFWRAYLSEAENNYSSKLSEQARALLPHRWTHLPVRVFIASIANMDDEAASKALGLAVVDRAAQAEARATRANGERRQERICAAAKDCRVFRVPTANHLVHNDALSQVAETVAELIARVRRR